MEEPTKVVTDLAPQVQERLTDELTDQLKTLMIEVIRSATWCS